MFIGHHVLIGTSTAIGCSPRNNGGPAIPLLGAAAKPRSARVGVRVP
jgi:hypothetical protein